MAISVDHNCSSSLRSCASLRRKPARRAEIPISPSQTSARRFGPLCAPSSSASQPQTVVMSRAKVHASACGTACLYGANVMELLLVSDITVTAAPACPGRDFAGLFPMHQNHAAGWPYASNICRFCPSNWLATLITVPRGMADRSEEDHAGLPFWPPTFARCLHRVLEKARGILLDPATRRALRKTFSAWPLNIPMPPLWLAAVNAPMPPTAWPCSAPTPSGQPPHHLARRTALIPSTPAPAMPSTPGRDHEGVETVGVISTPWPVPKISGKTVAALRFRRVIVQGLDRTRRLTHIAPPPSPAWRVWLHVTANKSPAPISPLKPSAPAAAWLLHRMRGN